MEFFLFVLKFKAEKEDILRDGAGREEFLETRDASLRSEVATLDCLLLQKARLYNRGKEKHN